MIPRLNIQFPLCRQWLYWYGKQYDLHEGEYLLNHARTGIVLVLRAALPHGGKVGVVVYNCHTVANSIVNAGCTPIFVDVTDELKIDITSIPANLDAIVVTNLFGIRNDISAIRKKCSKAVIIVDNAHGYGLPAEGDFTIYSINQGKFPALGEGGILKIVSPIDERKLIIDNLYVNIPSYGVIAQVRLFFSMLIKAMAYSHCIYWLTMILKKNNNSQILQPILMLKMAPGIRRLYAAEIPKIDKQIIYQCNNAERIKALFIDNCKLQIDDFLLGTNGFMAIVRCKKPDELKRIFAERGVETETHFKHAIEWAMKFGYVSGTCPKAEFLVKHLLMIPTYRMI